MNNNDMTILLGITKRAGDEENNGFWYNLGRIVLPGQAGAIDKQDQDTTDELERSNSTWEDLIAQGQAKLNANNTILKSDKGSWQNMVDNNGNALVAGGGLTGATIGALASKPENALQNTFLGGAAGIGATALARHFLKTK